MELIFLVICVAAFCTLSESSESSCKGCLILTPYIERNATEARLLSCVNDQLSLGLKSHSGFMTVKPEYNSNLFFWFFPSEKKLSETPWIIWLQGGPGISSLKGLFDIVGPLRVEDGKVKLRNVTWASDYSLLFLDNPVGAGFSFTDDDEGYPDNEDDVGDQMLVFLLQFLKMFPELRLAPLFIVGESYGGKYVPALGIQVHKYNSRNKKKEAINLKGIAIGNGLIEMRSIMHYSELCEVLGMMGGKDIDVLKGYEADVVRFIDEGRMVNASNRFNETIEFIKKQTGVSIYNFNQDPSSAAPSFEAYVNSPDVRDQIHVGDAKFDLNNQLVYNKMLADISNTTKPWVEELLDHYGVMLYRYFLMAGTVLAAPLVLRVTMDGGNHLPISLVCAIVLIGTAQIIITTKFLSPSFEAYVNSPDVRDQIHVGDAKFDLNNQLVYNKMLADISNTTKPWVEELLDHYGVMLYSGQYDVILAFGLSRHMHATLKWSQRAAFDQASRHRLLTRGSDSVVGYKKAGGNLVEVVIRRSGHMVPTDQPDVAKFVINSFIEEYK